MNEIFTNSYSPSLSQKVDKNSRLKGNLQNYKEFLTGRVEYLIEHKNNEIRGFLKLKKNPKRENIDKKNLIYRGSKIKYTDW